MFVKNHGFRMANLQIKGIGVLLSLSGAWQDERTAAAVAEEIRAATAKRALSRA